MPTFPSKKELDEQRQFAVYPADEYKLIIQGVKAATQKKYQSQEDEDIVNVKLEIISLRDGSDAIGSEGENLMGKCLFFIARPASVGFQKDGTPAKTRQLVAAALGQNINDEIILEAWEQLLGKEVDAEIIVKANTKGFEVNRVVKFFQKKAKKPVVDVPDSEIPVIN